MSGVCSLSVTAKMNKFYGYMNTSSQASFDVRSSTDIDGAKSFGKSEIV